MKYRLLLFSTDTPKTYSFTSLGVYINDIIQEFETGADIAMWDISESSDFRSVTRETLGDEPIAELYCLVSQGTADLYFDTIGGAPLIPFEEDNGTYNFKTPLTLTALEGITF